MISSLRARGPPIDGHERPAAVLQSDPKRRPLIDLPDELWTRINIEFYSDPADGVFKALLD